MQDQLTRLVGLSGFEVKAVQEVGAACCAHCGRASVDVKERPVVRVRDLPLAGRQVHLLRRKRRYRCAQCGLSFTESHPELPERQRVSARFRRRLFERTRQGGAHAEVAREEETTRYQVARAFRDGADERRARQSAGPPRRLSLDEAHHRRGHELATVVSDLDRRCIVEVLDGRSRRRVERYLRSLPDAAAIEVVSIDPYEAYRQAIKAALPRRGSSATASTSCAAPTPRSTRCGASASAARPGDIRRVLAAPATGPPGSAISIAPATGC